MDRRGVGDDHQIEHEPSGALIIYHGNSTSSPMIATSSEADGHPDFALECHNVLGTDHFEAIAKHMSDYFEVSLEGHSDILSILTEAFTDEIRKHEAEVSNRKASGRSDGSPGNQTGSSARNAGRGG